MTSTDLHFVDAHHHLWDLEHCNYPWLMARGKMRFFGDPGPIQKNYLIVDFFGDWRDHRPAKTVYIQESVEATDEVKESALLAYQQP